MKKKTTRVPSSTKTIWTYLQRQDSTEEHHGQRVSGGKHTQRIDLVFARVHALYGHHDRPDGGYRYCDVHRGGENERGCKGPSFCFPEKKRKRMFHSMRARGTCAPPFPPVKVKGGGGDIETNGAHLTIRHQRTSHFRPNDGFC